LDRRFGQQLSRLLGARARRDRGHLTLNRHRPVFITPLRDERENKAQRLKAQRAFRDSRQKKASRKKLRKPELSWASMLRQLGLSADTPLSLVPHHLEGTRLSRYSKSALRFLQENFHVVGIPASKGPVLHFKQGDDHMPQNIVRAAADELGTDVISPSTARKLWEAITTIVRSELKKNRRCKLPNIGIIKLNFRPAQKGGQTKVVFGKEVETKARKASNKLKILPLKALKEYAATLPVVAPKPKSKGKAA
jgi:nucleoid DNA-binding protein